MESDNKSKTKGPLSAQKKNSERFQRCIDAKKKNLDSFEYDGKTYVKKINSNGRINYIYKGAD